MMSFIVLRILSWHISWFESESWSDQFTNSTTEDSKKISQRAQDDTRVGPVGFLLLGGLFPHKFQCADFIFRIYFYCIEILFLFTPL